MNTRHAKTIRHTADLPDRGEARRLLDDAFSDFSDEDFEHALGGMHVLVHSGAGDEAELVAHGAVVRRQFLIGGVPRAAAFVEAVAVARSHRRQGLGSLVMAEVERLVVDGYGLGFLSASAAGAALYEQRGWPAWGGTTFVVSPSGLVPTPEEDDGVRVFDPAGLIDHTADLACDWRAGDAW